MFAITFKPQVFQPLKCNVFQPLKCNNNLKKTKYIVKCKNQEKISKKQVFNRKFLAEKINGRLAMLGYCVGNGYKYFTGMNYVDQLQSNLPIVIGLSTLIGYLSFKDEIKKCKSFWNELETFNGRVAMLELVFETFIETLLYIDENILFTIE